MQEESGHHMDHGGANAMDHSRCHQLCAKIIIIARVCDKVQFLPHNTKTTFKSSADCASLDDADLTQALLHPNHESSFTQIGETRLESRRKLTTLFKDHLNKPGAPPRVEQTTREPALTRVDYPAPQGCIKESMHHLHGWVHKRHLYPPYHLLILHNTGPEIRNII